MGTDASTSTRDIDAIEVTFKDALDTTDLEHRTSGIRARARWIDPHTRKRVTRALVPDEDAAKEFFHYLQASAELGIDKRILF
jgi:hypothetical protein